MKTGKAFMKNEKGSVLIQIMVASALALVVVLILGQMTVMMHRLVSQAQMKLSIFEVRNQLLSTILSEAAWQKTIQSPDNRTVPNHTICLTGTNTGTPPVDCSGISKPLTVRDANDRVVLAMNTPTSGFTRRGTPCNTFDAQAGNADCPIHIEATWATECSSPCNMSAPPLKISVTFQINDPESIGMDPRNLNFVLRR